MARSRSVQAASENPSPLMMQPGSKPTLAAVRLILLVLAGLVLSEPASAQSSEARSLHETVERLHRDIVDLQRHVYGGKAPAAPGPISPQQDQTQAGVGIDERRAASALVRVTALEGELRGLTGAIEEIRHKVDTAGRRLDKLVEDVDFRLSAIERTLAEVTAMATQGVAPAQSRTGMPAPEAAGSGMAPQVPGPSGQPGVLGTIPVDRLPSPGSAVETASPTPARPKSLLPEGTPKERYDFARRLLREGLLRSQDLVKAERAFEEFLTAHADHELADNARYWLAESHYVREDYNQAAAVFVEGYQTSPTGIKAPDNLLKLGMSLSRLGRGDEACAAFQELNEKFPDSADRIKVHSQTEWQKAGCE